MNPGKDPTSRWERRKYKPRQGRGCGGGLRGRRGRQFTIPALLQTTLLPFVRQPQIFFLFPQDALGSSRRCGRVQTVGSAHLARLRNMGPSRSHSTVPSPWDSSPAVPFAGLRGTSPRLGHPPRSRSASHLLTLGVDGVGEQQEEEVQEEPGREPTRGLSAKGAWKSLVRYGCGSMEASSLHGFFLPLGTSAELHLRQLDVPNHIGVCWLSGPCFF